MEFWYYCQSADINQGSYPLKIEVLGKLLYTMDVVNRQWWLVIALVYVYDSR